MSNQADFKSAERIYNQLCAVLDSYDWKYVSNEQEKTVSFVMTGEDVPMNFTACVDAERQLIRLLSPLPFKFAENKRLEGAVVTSAANFAIADGCFQYDVTDGETIFVITTSYRGSLISDETIRYLIACSVAVVDEFNDKFLMVAKGVMSMEEFVEKY